MRNAWYKGSASRCAVAALSFAVLACGKKAQQADHADGGAQAEAGLPHFSFFLTSLSAMQDLSGSLDGFGGDLRFGETGDGAGLRGADKICATIAERSMRRAGAKGWRAFLSATKAGPDGGPVHAVDRIGEGPWYDRLGRLVSENKADLIATRPGGADDAIKNDLPNEFGVPNHNPDGRGEVDNHDVLTGSDAMGHLFEDNPQVTCDDWTKSAPDAADRPRVGHSWPRSFGGPGGGFGGTGAGAPFGPRRGGRAGSDAGAAAFPGPPPGAFPPGGFGDGGIPTGFPPGFPPDGFPDGGFPPGFPPGFPDGGFPPGFPPGFPDGGFPDGGFPPGFRPGGFDQTGGIDASSWISSLNEAGCAPSARLNEMGPPNEADPTVGSGGGYGGIYCFALVP